jgi:predicted nucleic acid-binding protein
MAGYLLDTNVVLRLIDRQDPKHGVCRAAVDALIERGEEVCLAPQILVEFWVVATKPPPPESNGLGWSPDEADHHLGGLCGHFELPPERADLFDRWRKLAKESKVRGKRTHDARIAAFMLLHGIESVLTLNPGDFRGFGVSVVEPEMLDGSTST